MYGDEVLDRITADPVGVFLRFPDSAAARAEAAAESWYATRAVRDLHVELAPHGLAHLAGKIHASFGDRAMAVIREDPYRLTEIDGVGFVRADTIALAADVPLESGPPRSGCRLVPSVRRRGAVTPTCRSRSW